MSVISILQFLLEKMMMFSNTFTSAICKHTFLPSWVRWIAIDKGGSIYGYSDHPEIISLGVWLEKEDSISRWGYFRFPDNKRLEPEDWTKTCVSLERVYNAKISMTDKMEAQITYMDTFKDNAAKWTNLIEHMYYELKEWARKSMEEALKSGIPNLSYDVEKLLNSWVTIDLSSLDVQCKYWFEHVPLYVNKPPRGQQWVAYKGYQGYIVSSFLCAQSEHLRRNLNMSSLNWNLKELGFTKEKVEKLIHTLKPVEYTWTFEVSPVGKKTGVLVIHRQFTCSEAYRDKVIEKLPSKIKNTIKFGEKLFKINLNKDASLEAMTFGNKLAEILRGRFGTYTSCKGEPDPYTKAGVYTIFGSTNFSDLEEK